MLGAKEQREAVVQLLTTVAAERTKMDHWFLLQAEGNHCNEAIIPTMERLCQLQSRLGIVVGEPLALAMLFQERQMPSVMQDKRWP